MKDENGTLTYIEKGPNWRTIIWNASSIHVGLNPFERNNLNYFIYDWETALFIQPKYTLNKKKYQTHFFGHTGSQILQSNYLR